MPTVASLGDRRGLLRERGALVVASVIASHGAAPARDGFRLTDVRFFFFLFSNWLEHDLVHATEALELTQVRRLLQRLVTKRWATAKGTGRARRFVLTAAGLAAMVEVLVSDVDARSFEEALFVACFARCYGKAIALRAPASHRRSIAERLSYENLLRAAERRVARVIDDLDERVRSSVEMQREALALRRAGLDDDAIAAKLDRQGAYQLQHVRGFGEVMRALPPDLLRFELEEGIGLRSASLFGPMAAQAKAQREILSALRNPR